MTEKEFKDLTLLDFMKSISSEYFKNLPFRFADIKEEKILDWNEAMKDPVALKDILSDPARYVLESTLDRNLTDSNGKFVFRGDKLLFMDKNIDGVYTADITLLDKIGSFSALRGDKVINKFTSGTFTVVGTRYEEYENIHLPELHRKLIKNIAAVQDEDPKNFANHITFYITNRLEKNSAITDKANHPFTIVKQLGQTKHYLVLDIGVQSKAVVDMILDIEESTMDHPIGNSIRRVNTILSNAAEYYVTHGPKNDEVADLFGMGCNTDVEAASQFALADTIKPYFVLDPENASGNYLSTYCSLKELKDERNYRSLTPKMQVALEFYLGNTLATLFIKQYEELKKSIVSDIGHTKLGIILAQTIGIRNFDINNLIDRLTKDVVEKTNGGITFG